jgi:hypothetical protein
MDGRTAARQAGVDQGYIALAFLVLEHAKEFVPISSQAKKTSSIVTRSPSNARNRRNWISRVAMRVVEPANTFALVLKANAEANLTNLRPGQILSYPTGDLRTAEARHTRS